MIYFFFNNKKSFKLYDVSYDPVDSLCKALDILGVETCHGNAAIVSEIDMILFLEGFDLRDSQASEGEHTDLIHNVVPSAWSPQFNKCFK